MEVLNSMGKMDYLRNTKCPSNYNFISFFIRIFYPYQLLIPTMYPITYALLAILGLTAFAAACAAPENKDSSFGSLYSAIFIGNTLGAVLFYSIDGYVSVGVGLTGLPASRGPFTYRINSKDPYGACDGRSQTFNPYCGTYDARTPAEKEVGDLSGKHGLISGTSEAEVYDDRYLSLNSKNRAFIGQMSVVIEDAKGNRVACADIEDILSPLSGDKANAAKPAAKLNIPQQIKTLLG